MTDRHASWFKFYPADFMGGVRGLTPQEVGLYTMLLCRIYEENGPIEFNVLRLSTYCGMRGPSFEKTVQKLVDLGKLHLHEGMLSNTRAEIEISNRANDLKNASHAGKVSWEKRQQNQQQASTDVQPPFNHTDTDTDTEEDKEAAECARGENPISESPPSEDLIWRILHALGFDRGKTLPKWWIAPDAPMIVSRWQTDLGLTPDEICQVAVANHRQHGSPANGPKTLAKPMQDFADAKHAPPLAPGINRQARVSPPRRLWNLDPNQFNPDGSLRQ